MCISFSPMQRFKKYHFDKKTTDNLTVQKFCFIPLEFLGWPSYFWIMSRCVAMVYRLVTYISWSSHFALCFIEVKWFCILCIKTEPLGCAPSEAQPSEDSDQPGHPPSLCCPHEETLGPLATHLAHSEDPDQTGRIPSLGWAHTFCWFCHVAAHYSFKVWFGKAILSVLAHLSFRQYSQAPSVCDPLFKHLENHWAIKKMCKVA